MWTHRKRTLFYPFADKAVGETAETDDVITNAVSSSGTYNGTVKRLKTAGENYGTLTFERFPYPYVYSDWSCTNLLTAEAQSIHIKSNGLARGGAEVSINKIAEKLYEDRNDKDYTIELFWRDNVTWTYETAFSYSGLADHNFYYGYNNTTWIRLNFTSTLLDYGASICDGLWHHLAVIYDHETKKITMVGDYSLVSSTEFTETGTVASPYFILGSNQAENNMIEDVEFSCLRVTQRKLETSEFMVAYDVPVGNGNTVFHWGFDGVNGSNIGTIADRSESKIDHTDVVRRVQFDTVSCRCKSKHDHLERNDHTEDTQIIEDLRDQTVHSHHIPCCHGAAQQDQRD